MAASLDCLMLASIAFLISVSSIATTWRRQVLMGAGDCSSLPRLHQCHRVGGQAVPPIYYLAIAVWQCVPARSLPAYSPEARSLCRGSRCRHSAVGYGCGVGSAERQSGPGSDHHTHRAEPGCRRLVLEASRRHHGWRSDHGRRVSFCGRLVFPCSALIAIYLPSVNVESEVWNIPKYLVALGMILTLLEDQIRAQQLSRLSRRTHRPAESPAAG